MHNVARFFVVSAVPFAVACGGSTSTPPDGVDGSADTSGAFDVAHDAIGDLVVGDVLAKWQKLGVVHGSGPCPTASCSSSWDVSPDGHIATTRLGDAGVAQMTQADLSELDSIVSSQPFVDGMTNRFVCDQPPSDVGVSLRLDRDGVSQTQNVTGCVYTGPMGNLPRRVNDLVTKY